MTTSRLSEPLLDRFEAALRAAGAPVVDLWAPGASDAEIDEALGPLGVDLPDEGRVWWRWHNGVLPGAAPARYQLVPRRVQHTVAGSAHVWEVISARMRKEGDDELVRVQLLPLVSDKPLLYLSAGGGRGAPAPIWTMLPGDPPTEQLPTIGTLVERWCWLLDEGVWTTTTDGEWRVDLERLPVGWYRQGVL